MVLLEVIRKRSRVKSDGVRLAGLARQLVAANPEKYKIAYTAGRLELLHADWITEDEVLWGLVWAGEGSCLLR